MAFVPVMIPAAAVAARRRRILRKFEEAGADRPEGARTLAELGLQESHALSHLIRSGEVVATEGGRYFVSAEGIARWNRTRNIYVFIVLVVVALALVVLMLFLRAR